MDKFDGLPYQQGHRPRYDFILYVAGSGARSSKTVANMRRLCDRYLDGRHLVCDNYNYRTATTKTTDRCCSLANVG